MIHLQWAEILVDLFSPLSHLHYRTLQADRKSAIRPIFHTAPVAHPYHNRLRLLPHIRSDMRRSAGVFTPKRSGVLPKRKAPPS